MGMRRSMRSAALVSVLSAGAAVSAFAQSPQLVFTAAAPERTSPEANLQASAVVEERGLALWSGVASDFGVGVTLSGSRWAVRSIASMTALPFGGHDRPTFQQLEIARPLLSIGSMSLAGGGGVRQEWDGTRVLIARTLAGYDIGGGRLQGSLVMERAMSSPLRHDGADVISSLGWSRRVNRSMTIGIEGIGQDLEGLWDPAEADGGAKLLIGPSLHTQSPSGRWTATLTAGPVVHTLSTAPATGLPAGPASSLGNHFGMFASASWVPSPRR